LLKKRFKKQKDEDFLAKYDENINKVIDEGEEFDSILTKVETNVVEKP
jgi:hypothetical protein